MEKARSNVPRCSHPTVNRIGREAVLRLVSQAGPELDDVVHGHVDQPGLVQGHEVPVPVLPLLQAHVREEDERLFLANGD